MNTKLVLELAKESVSNIKQANKNLVQANEYNDSYGRWWSYFFVFLTIVIVILDYLN